jgi:hypothetical protein
MRYVLLSILIISAIHAQSFSKEMLLGSWELSSVNLNSTVSFGKYHGKQRGEILELVFNPQGRIRVLNTNDVYNFEIEDGQLKIYETKVYKNSYKVKYKYRYDLFKIVGDFEGCKEIKVAKKKIPGYTSRYHLKMCKISNLPQPTYKEEISKYKF